VTPPAIEEIGEDAAVITVGGTHVWTGEEIHEALASLKDAGRRRIVVDAGGAPWLNSKVLDALVRGAADLDPGHGGGLALITRHEYIKQILQVSVTGGAVFLADSREEALEVIRAP
jgi:anti-anti-sigma regulatory factor